MTGHGKVGFLIEIETDNTNRVMNSLKTIMSKKGGTLASKGAVAFNFKRVGRIRVNAEACAEDQFMDIILDAGAEDMEPLENEEVNTDTYETDYVVL